MNKSDIAKIKAAIEELEPGGDPQKGMDILYQLVGYGEHPVITLRRVGRPINVKDVKPAPQLGAALNSLLNYEKKEVGWSTCEECGGVTKHEPHCPQR